MRVCVFVSLSHRRLEVNLKPGGVGNTEICQGQEKFSYMDLISTVDTLIYLTVNVIFLWLTERPFVFMLNFFFVIAVD